MSELQSQHTFDQNKDGTVSEDEAKFFLDSHDEVNWEDFLASAWPQIKPFIMLDKGLFGAPTSEPPLYSTVESLSDPDVMTQVMHFFLMFCRTASEEHSHHEAQILFHIIMNHFCV
jgi:hypothetical protein